MMSFGVGTSQDNYFFPYPRVYRGIVCRVDRDLLLLYVCTEQNPSLFNLHLFAGCCEPRLRAYVRNMMVRL